MSGQQRTPRPGPLKPAGSNVSSGSATSTPQIRFLFQVQSIEPKNGSHMLPQFEDWVPPKQTTEINTLDQTQWYLWTPAAVSAVLGNPPEETAPCNSTSLFWDFRTCRYYGVPGDCSTDDVESMEYEGGPVDWKILHYEYIQKNGSDMTKVGFWGYNEGLGAPASAALVPQLIPYTSALPPGHTAAQQGNSRLVGKLSLIVALAAMSCDFGNIPQAMREAFQPPSWHRHELGTGRHYQRGVVVRIRRYLNATRLDAWERGDYGPLVS